MTDAFDFTQLNTSDDGIDWSDPSAFDDYNLSDINPDPCPVGYVCKVNEGIQVDVEQKRLCSEIKEQVVDAGYGHILNGTYCPGGFGPENAGLFTCPSGFYCDDPAAKPKICPKGYYCPAKTSNHEDYKCSQCNEGATRMPVRIGALVALILCILVLPVLVIFLVRYIKRKRDASKQDVSSTAKLEAQKHSDLQRAKPMLLMIDERLGDSFAVKLDSNGDLIDYDAESLFDAIDENGDESLCFSELEKALNLRGDKLKVFIRSMNEASGVSSLSSVQQVTRAVFTSSFLDTIQAVSNFEPSHEDASDLFNEIATDMEMESANTIPLDGLKNSRLAMFLSDKQILIMIRLFQEKVATAASADQEAQQDAPQSRDPRHSLVNRPAESSTFISKELFTAFYPSVLSALVGTQEIQLDPCDLQFEHLSLHVNVNNKDVPVVNDVTGRVRSGTMTALMGGSGAGKTSLLNALCGRAYYGTVSGKIVINGQVAEIDDCTDVMGFVPQDDIVFAELTVKENLIFAGKFKLPRGTPLRYIEELADDVIADLGLTRVADSMVGDVHRRGVSGGEKKRVNIGLELMAKPSILFLDEPTSGLDSSSAMVVMQSLKRLVQNQGMTICSVIHQPRKTIFELFDSLILLGVGGNLVYHGATSTALDYFTNMHYELPEGESLADWLIDISSGELSQSKPTMNRQKSTFQEVQEKESAKENRERLYKAWRLHFLNLSTEDMAIYASPEKSNLPAKRVKPPFLSQAQYQLHRCALLFQRNFTSKMQEVFLIIGGTVAIALLSKTFVLSQDSTLFIPYQYTVLHTAGFSQATEIFEEAIPAFFNHSVRGFREMTKYLLMVSVVISVLSAIASSKAFTEKRVEFFREAASGIDINAYFLAVHLFDTLEMMLKMTVTALFAIYLRNTVVSGWSMVLNFIMLGWIASSWGLLFPLCIPPKSVILMTAFFMIFTSLLLCGSPGTAAIEYSHMVENPFMNAISSFLSSTRFFIEAMAVSEFKTTPEQHGFTTNITTVNPDAVSNLFVKLNLGAGDPNVIEQSDRGWYWFVLPSFFVGLTVRILGLIMLHACNRPQRIKKGILIDLKASSSMKIGCALFLVIFVASVAVSAVTFSL